MENDDETHGHTGCTQITGGVRCQVCGDHATRLVGLCEQCWKMKPIWQEIYDKSPAYAKKREYFQPG